MNFQRDIAMEVNDLKILKRRKCTQIARHGKNVVDQCKSNITLLMTIENSLLLINICENLLLFLL